MGGMRTAGDLVARMQIARGMKIDETKKYVADRLGATVADLTEPIIMKEVREDLNLGLLHPQAGSPKCMEAGVKVVTSIVAPGRGLAGVVRHSLDIEESKRTIASVKEVFQVCGLKPAGTEAYLS